MANAFVIQADGKPPTLVVGGLFCELDPTDKPGSELDNCLHLNTGITPNDDKGRPTPLWVTAKTFANLTKQSQTAVGQVI